MCLTTKQAIIKQAQKEETQFQAQIRDLDGWLLEDILSALIERHGIRRYREAAKIAEQEHWEVS